MKLKSSVYIHNILCSSLDFPALYVKMEIAGLRAIFVRKQGEVMYQVGKRDGKVTSFDISKISVASTKAFEATGKQYNPDIIDLLALKVTADYQDKIADGKITVEQIQAVTEPKLIISPALKPMEQPWVESKGI